MKGGGRLRGGASGFKSKLTPNVMSSPLLPVRIIRSGLLQLAAFWLIPLVSGQTGMDHEHGAGFPEPDWVVIAPEGLEERVRRPATGPPEAVDALSAGWKAYHAGEWEVAGRWFHSARLLDQDCYRIRKALCSGLSAPMMK